MRKILTSVLGTVMIISVCFLTEPVFPLGSWMWGIILIGSAICFLWLHKQEISNWRRLRKQPRSIFGNEFLIVKRIHEKFIIAVHRDDQLTIYKCFPSDDVWHKDYYQLEIGNKVKVTGKWLNIPKSGVTTIVDCQFTKL